MTESTSPVVEAPIPAFLDRNLAIAATPNVAPVVPAPAKPEFAYVDADEKPCTLPQAHGIRVSAPNGSLVYGVGHANRRAAMFAAFGMMTLATATAKKAQNPIAEIEARFARISDTAWGDEKPAKAKREKRDPLAELVDVVRTVKASKSLAFDEAAFRAKCADAKFRRDAKRVPEVAAELARRNAATGTSEASGLGSL